MHVAQERVDARRRERVVDRGLAGADRRLQRVQLLLVEWTLCGSVAPLNVQRTVSPVETVTSSSATMTSLIP